jgi:MurNAc alpha-1-phosphate uridylyltransferase|tara:strand:- start:1505 stop:2194 length:690 start_codon:yes stop_codon:yes gene_type:complete
MKIKTAFILCAGYGKRLNPVTLKTPKPLLKYKKLSMLEHTINLIENLGINKIKINTFYLENQIIDFISNHKLKKKIEIIKDGKEILGTGGGIFNLINSSNDDDFLVFNPDTFWSPNYLDIINKMSDMYFSQKMENCLLVTHKEKSYDKRFDGDFGMLGNNLIMKDRKYVYTGCQIINKISLNAYSRKYFSISEVWNKKLKKNKLYALESKERFIHLTDLEIYNNLLKND